MATNSYRDRHESRTPWGFITSSIFMPHVPWLEDSDPPTQGLEPARFVTVNAVHNTHATVAALGARSRLKLTVGENDGADLIH